MFKLNINGAVVSFTIIWIHARVTAIVEEPSEGEFKESVNWMFPVVKCVVHLVLVGTVAQLVRNNWIKVGSIRSEANLWDVRCCLGSQSGFEIYAIEKGMRL